MDDHARLSVSVPARGDALPFVRDLLGCFASLLGASEEPVEAIKLAVHEAAANVVEHAYEREGDGTLSVKARSDDGLLAVVVSDMTTTVIANSNGKSPQLPRATAEAGRGLPIMEALADDLELRQAVGTQAELTFALAPSAVAAGADG